MANYGSRLHRSGCDLEMATDVEAEAEEMSIFPLVTSKNLRGSGPQIEVSMNEPLQILVVPYQRELLITPSYLVISHQLLEQ